jgi:geranylgeranyl pyrophosphate synthase
MADICGTGGLVQGEYEDVMAEGKDLPLVKIEEIYTKKTSRLFELCMYSGARIVCNDHALIRPLVDFGRYLGQAFQAIDDILDVTSNEENLGKSAGKDLAQDKATVVKALGIDAAREWARNATERAVSTLEKVRNDQTANLKELALWMLRRVM